MPSPYDNKSGDIRTTISRLFREEFFDHSKSYALAIVFMVIEALATAASAWIIKDVIDDVFVAKNGSMVAPVAIGITLIYLTKGVASFIHTYTMARVGARITESTRRKAVRAVMAQNIPFFQTHDISNLINRIINSTKAAGTLINGVMTSLVKDLLTVVFLVALMFIQDWKLAIASLLIGPPMVFFVTRLSRRIKKTATSEFEFNAKYLQLLSERFHNISFVKAYQLEEKTVRDTDETAHSLRRRAEKIAQKKSLNSPLMESFGGVAVGLIIAWGGYSVIHLGTEPGRFFSFIVAFLMAYEPIKRIAKFRIQLVEQSVPVGYYFELVDMLSVAEDQGRDLPIKDGEIRFENVSFHYDDAHKAALNGVSFTAKPNELTALVGQSGAGKSTVFSLMEKFYEPTNGKISIDDIDISLVSKTELREKIAFISQDTTIFSGTIADNIRLGRLGADDHDVITAAKRAHIAEFIETLPDGYQTNIGENGISLSGGQKQRISIARAILRDAPILLLDEATSALDSETEHEIQMAIEEIGQSKTVLVIAHRLSTIKNAQQILVFDDGKIVDSGRFSDLSQKDGVFKTLHDLQFTQD